MELCDPDTIYVLYRTLNLVIARTARDNVGSAARLDQVVKDAALDHLRHTRSLDQILLVGVEPVDGDAGGVGVGPVERRMNADRLRLNTIDNVVVDIVVDGDRPVGVDRA